MRWPRRDVAAALVLGAAFALRAGRALHGMPASEDALHRWWIGARWLETGAYADPLRHQAWGAWLPGYDVLCALAAAVAGHGAPVLLMWVGVAASTATVFLAGRLAEGVRPGAAIPAMALLALDPLHLAQSAVPLPDTLAAFLVAAGLLALGGAAPGRPWLAGALLLAACALRYEAWLVVAGAGVWRLRSGSGLRALAPMAGAAAFALAWTALAWLQAGSPFAATVAQQLGSELQAEAAVGFVPSSPLGRLSWFLRVYAWPMAPALALAALALPERAARPLLWAALPLAAAVLAAILLGVTRGSARYLLPATPLVVALAGVGWCRLRAWLAPRLPDPRRAAAAAVALGALLLSAQAVLAAREAPVEGREALTIAPRIRAGAWVAGLGLPPDALVVANSAVAAFHARADPARLVGPNDLPDDRGEALALLRRQPSYVIHVVQPEGKYPELDLARTFPEMREGGSSADLALAFDAHGWENDHGAQEVRVYRVLPG